MWLFAAIVQIVICVFLILVILLNSGKGAEMGAVFAGGSDSLLGASGGLNFITKITAFAALLYMVSSATLTLSQRSGVLEGSLLKEVVPVEVQEKVTDGELGSTLLDRKQDGSAAGSEESTNAPLANKIGGEEKVEGKIQKDTASKETEEKTGVPAENTAVRIDEIRKHSKAVDPVEKQSN